MRPTDVRRPPGGPSEAARPPPSDGRLPTVPAEIPPAPSPRAYAHQTHPPQPVNLPHPADMPGCSARLQRIVDGRGLEDQPAIVADLAQRPRSRYVHDALTEQVRFPVATYHADALGQRRISSTASCPAQALPMSNRSAFGLPTPSTSAARSRLTGRSRPPRRSPGTDHPRLFRRGQPPHLADQRAWHSSWLSSSSAGGARITTAEVGGGLDARAQMRAVRAAPRRWPPGCISERAHTQSQASGGGRRLLRPRPSAPALPRSRRGCQLDAVGSRLCGLLEQVCHLRKAHRTVANAVFARISLRCAAMFATLRLSADGHGRRRRRQVVQVLREGLGGRDAVVLRWALAAVGPDLPCGRPSVPRRCSRLGQMVRSDGSSFPTKLSAYAWKD